MKMMSNGRRPLMQDHRYWKTTSNMEYFSNHLKSSPNSKLKQKAQFALRTKITALHNQLAFEGKGVRVKSLVILQGDLNTRKRNVNIVVFWENAPDTDKQINLIHKYIFYISVQNHGPCSSSLNFAHMKNCRKVRSH
jgi:hypothetical protein